MSLVRSILSCSHVPFQGSFDRFFFKMKTFYSVFIFKRGLKKKHNKTHFKKNRFKKNPEVEHLIKVYASFDFRLPFRFTNKKQNFKAKIYLKAV